MDDHWLPARPVLRPGLRVVRRDDDHLQVGLSPAHRVVLPDVAAVRGLLEDLRLGQRPPAELPEVRRWCHALAARGLLVDAADVDRSLADASARDAALAVFAQAGPEAPGRLEARRHARVAIEGDEPWRAVALRLAASAGLSAAGPRDTPVARLLVSARGEPVRADLDPLMRAGAAHVLVTNVGARVTIGPFVAPGLTACLRCVDAHHCDTDPRHAMIVEQHRPASRVSPATRSLMHLAAGLGGTRPGDLCRGRAARDLVGDGHRRRGPGRRAARLDAAPAVRVQLGRRAGGRLRLTTGHQNSLSSLPSIARRFFREHSSQ